MNGYVPGDAIDQELAKILVDTASILAKGRTVTAAEIDLWMKHVGPVWKGPRELTEHGLTQWYKEMQTRGLVAKGPNQMEEFILHGVHASSRTDGIQGTAAQKSDTHP